MGKEKAKSGGIFQFKGIKIEKRLKKAFNIITIISALSSLIGLIALIVVTTNFRNAMENYALPQGDIALFMNEYAECRSNMRGIIGYEDQDLIDSLKEKHAIRKEATYERLETIGETMVTSEGKAAYAKIKNALEAYFKVESEVIRIGATTDQELCRKAQEMAIKEITPLYTALDEATLELMEINVQKEKEMDTVCTILETVALSLMAVLVVLIIVISKTISNVIAKGIAVPLTELEEKFVEFANGNLSTEFSYSKEEDEIAGIMNASHDVVARLKEIITDVESLSREMGMGNFTVESGCENAFYCITRKENVKLIEKIESVLQQIMFDDPMFEGILNKKYFGHNSLSHTPLYTKEELAYIESLGIIKIKMLMNQRPSCYEEDGEIKGIWAGYIDLISKKSGIRFEMETGTFDQNSDDIYRNLMEDNYLVLRTDKAIAFNPIDDVIVSSPLMDVEVSYIKRQEEIVTGGFTNYIIALPPELSYVEPVLLEENPSYEIDYYKNAESCMDAVINKNATMAIINTFRASYLLQKPKYADKLAEVPGTGYSNQIHLMANKENAMLISVINKAIIHISSEEKEEIVTKELLMHPYVVGFDDIWYSYWEWIVGIIALVFISLYIYVVMTRKVTKLQFEKKEYEMLQKKIQLDELTGLYNRTFFYQIVKEKIEQSEEEMCIISVDISNFKVVNELYGESVGDGLLKEVAQNLKKLDVDNKMIIARFMSDHYYICLPKSEFNKIHLPKKFETSLEDMEVRVVYGIFFAELHSEILISVMCDRALLAAHDKNNNYLEYIHLYNNEKHKYIMAEQEIENDMEKALSNKQFYIVIQPKFNPRTRKIVGGESLVRWKHPERGTISPSIFVKVFEKNGFIIHLDYYVWEETCRLLSKWKQEGKDVIPLSINVSRAHFYGNDLKDKLTELVLKYGLDTKDLELEITESLCGEDPGIIYAKIRQLQDMGFKIAMDDFGSGYSSLNMLKEMPLDIIKMDLKFLDGEENKSRLILKSLITMAQAMELNVVVEGVENLPQVEFLAQFKDCSLQGYYFSRPVITSEFEHLLENN